MREAERAWSGPGRRALVTGASSGIGEAFARALAARGTDLVLVARREERLRALADELADAHGVRTDVVPVDLADADGAARAWEAAAFGGEIHLLVNNAGFGLSGRFVELDRRRQMEMLRVDCLAVAELAHRALRPMRARRSGAVVNVASNVAFQPVPGFAAYAAGKAFVLSLSQALAEELRDSGVRVLALCPGAVPTGFQSVAGMERSPDAPGTLTAEQVVEAALDGLADGDDVVVPGALNRAAAAVSRRLPLRWAARVAARVMQRIDRG